MIFNFELRQKLRAKGLDPDKAELVDDAAQQSATVTSTPEVVKPKSSAIAAGARSFGAGVLPTTAGLIGGSLAAAPFTGGTSMLLPLVVGLGSGIVSSLGADWLQKKAIKAASPELAQQLETDVQEHPIATTVGSIASALPTMRPTLKTLPGAGRALRNITTGVKPHGADVNNLMNVGIGATIQPALRAYNDPELRAKALAGDPEALGILGLEAVGGAYISDPRKYTKYIGLHPNVYREDIFKNAAAKHKESVAREAAGEEEAAPESKLKSSIAPEGTYQVGPEGKVTKDTTGYMKEKVREESESGSLAELRKQEDRAKEEAERLKKIAQVEKTSQEEAKSLAETYHKQDEIVAEHFAVSKEAFDAASNEAKAKLREEYKRQLQQAKLEDEALNEPVLGKEEKVEEAKVKPEELTSDEETIKSLAARKLAQETVSNAPEKKISTEVQPEGELVKPEPILTRAEGGIKERGTKKYSEDESSKLSEPIEEAARKENEYQDVVNRIQKAYSRALLERRYEDAADLKRRFFQYFRDKQPKQDISGSMHETETSKLEEIAAKRQESLIEGARKKGIPLTPSKYLLNMFKRLGVLRNVNVDDSGRIFKTEVDPVTKKEVKTEVKGEALAREGLKEALVKLNPFKQTIETLPHELTHVFRDDLLNHGTDADKKLVTKGDRIIEKSKEYQDWRAAREKEGKASSVEEFFVTYTGEDAIKRVLKTDSDGAFKNFLKDFWSNIKARYGKGETKDFVRLMSNRLINEAPFHETFGKSEVRVKGTGESKLSEEEISKEDLVKDRKALFDNLQDAQQEMEDAYHYHGIDSSEYKAARKKATQLADRVLGLYEGDYSAERPYKPSKNAEEESGKLPTKAGIPSVKIQTREGLEPEPIMSFVNNFEAKRTAYARWLHFTKGLSQEKAIAKALEVFPPVPVEDHMREMFSEEEGKLPIGSLKTQTLNKKGELVDKEIPAINLETNFAKDRIAYTKWLNETKGYPWAVAFEKAVKVYPLEKPFTKEVEQTKKSEEEGNLPRPEAAGKVPGITKTRSVNENTGEILTEGQSVPLVQFKSRAYEGYDQQRHIEFMQKHKGMSKDDAYKEATKIQNYIFEHGDDAYGMWKKLSEDEYSKLPTAPVDYSGKFEGDEILPEFHNYTLKESIPGHPKGSTVSQATLAAKGYRIPDDLEQHSYGEMKSEMEKLERLKSGKAQEDEGSLPMRNPQVDTPEFKKWFGDSKVVDKKGNPLVVYHESGKKDIDIFREESHFGTSEQANTHLEKIGGNRGDMDRVIYPAYISIKNPWTGLDVGQHNWSSQIKRAKELGHDGIVYENTREGPGKSYIVFKPEQIKSAIGNKGTFDDTNPDIRFQEDEGKLPTGKFSDDLTTNRLRMVAQQNNINPTTLPVARTEDEFHLGKFRPEIDKIPEPRIKEAFTDFLEKLTENRGKYVNVNLRKVRNLADLSTLIDNIKNPKSYLKQDTQELQNVRTWFDNDVDGKPNIELNDKETAIRDAIVDSLKEVKQDQIAKLGKESGFDPEHLPQTPDNKVINELQEHPDSIKSQEYKQQFLDYQTRELGNTPEEAAKNLKVFLKGFSSERINIAEQYAHLDKQDELRIPPEWRDKNLLNRLTRFMERTSRRFAYQDAIKSQEGLLDRIKEYRGNKSVSFVLDNIIGINPKHEQFRNAAQGVIRAGRLGILTGVKDFATNITLGMQHQQNPLQTIKSTLDAWSNMSKNITDSFKTGRNRTSMNSLEWNETPDIIGGLRRLRDVISDLQGRNWLEQMTRATAFGMGRFTTLDFHEQYHNGNLGKQGKKWFDDFGKGIEWRKSELSPEDINKMSARFVDSVQGTYDYRGLPAIAMEGTLAPVLSLARWNIEKANNFAKYVITPLKNGNPYPALMATVGGLIGGAAVTKIVELMTGKKEKTPKLEELKAADETNNKYPYGGLAYKLTGLASASGYAGVLTDLAKGFMDAGYGKNKPQWYNNILLDAVADTADLTMSFIKSGNENGFDTDLVTDFASKLVEDNIQTSRIILAHTNDERKSDIERANKFRDLRIFNTLSGNPIRDLSTDWGQRQLGNREVKEFKRTGDIDKVVEKLPQLISKALNNAKEGDSIDPEKLRSELEKLKKNSYQTMPNPETLPFRFIKYITFLEKSQGKEAAQARLVDYIYQNELNSAKSSAIPSL